MLAVLGLGTNNIDMRELVELYLQMGDHDHLEGTLTTIHVKHDEEIDENKVDFRSANSFGDAKARVRDAIAKQVGSDHADDIMSKVLTDNPRRDGLRRYCKPNRKAMTKTQLSRAIELTYKQMTSQFSELTLTERRHLLNCLSQRTTEEPARFMKDRTASSAIHLAASAKNTSQRPRFLDAVHKYEKLCEEFMQIASVPVAIDDDYRKTRTVSGNFDLYRKLNEDASLIDHEDVDQDIKDKWSEVLQEASKIRDAFVYNDAGEKIELSNDQHQILCNVDLTKLTPDDLKHLFDGAKEEIANQVAEYTIKPLVEQIEKKEWKINEHSQHNGLNMLLSIYGQLGVDDHLRQQGDILYQKNNHPGVVTEKWYHLNHAKTLGFGRRAEKVRRAKQSVQGMLAEYLNDSLHCGNSQEALARSLMKPWMQSYRALSKADLGRIIQRANQWVRIHNGAVLAIRRSGNQTLADLKRLEDAPQELMEPFAAYCGFQEFQEVWTQYQFFFSFEQMLCQLMSDSSRENEQDREELLEKARSVASDLLRYKMSHYMRQMLNQFRKGGALGEAQLKELVEKVAEDRAKQQEALAPCYSSFYNHVVVSAKRQVEYERSQEIRAASLKTLNSVPRTDRQSDSGGQNRDFDLSKVPFNQRNAVGNLTVDRNGSDMAVDKSSE